MPSQSDLSVPLDFSFGFDFNTLKDAVTKTITDRDNSGASEELAAAKLQQAEAITNIASSLTNGGSFPGQEIPLPSSNKVDISNANTIRMTQINTYYSKKYKAYSEIIKIIIFMCIPLLIITILTKRHILPSSVGTILGTILFIICLILIIPKIIDISYRNNMVFDQYDFSLDPSDPRLPSVNENRSEVLEQEAASGLTCSNASCCNSGMSFDRVIGKCKNNVESFLSGQSNQTMGSTFNPYSIY
jgi:hypothetical protein